MEDAKNLPADINELQAWKLMMDSMVKFIQASTRLMNTFNDKANSQLSLIAPEECETSFRTLLAPAFSVLEKSHPKRKISKFSRPASPEVEETQNGESVPKDKIVGEIKSSGEEQIDENNNVIDIIKSEQNENDDKQTNAEKRDHNEKEDNDDNLCSTTCETILPVENNTIMVNGDENAEQTPDEHVATDYESTSFTSCNCPVGPNIKPVNSDQKGVKAVENADITKLMTFKLEQAQKEIDDLKKELVRLQSAKTNKVTALYKEIMKESTPDKPLKPSYSTKIETRHEQDRTLSTRKVPIPPEVPIKQIIPDRQRALVSSSTFRSDYLIGGQSGTANWQTTAQRRNTPHRTKPRLTDEMVYLRRSTPQRHFVQASTAYEQPPLEIYSQLNYQPLQKQVYPLYTRPQSPTQERNYSYQQGDTNHIGRDESQFEYICGDHCCHPLYQSYGNVNYSYSKEDNYQSLSDDGSADEYLCDGDLV